MRHFACDGRSPVAALSDVARVAESLHQLSPCPGDTLGTPTRAGWLPGEAVARYGRNHQVECVLGAASVPRRIGERPNGVEELEHGAWPSVSHDHRERVL